MDQIQPWRSQKLDHSCCHCYLYSASPAKMEIPYPNRNAVFLETKHPLLSHTSVLITMVIITCHYVTVRKILHFSLLASILGHFALYCLCKSTLLQEYFHNTCKLTALSGVRQMKFLFIYIFLIDG